MTVPPPRHPEPLRHPEPPLSPRAMTWFGIAAVVLLIGAAAALVVMVAVATEPDPTSTDGRYLPEMVCPVTVRAGSEHHSMIDSLIDQ